jgi:hypothetical protein
VSRSAREGSRLGAVGDAFAELLSREFSLSPGHLSALLSCCAFAPSLLTFWFVNGVVDFSTAFLLGSLGGPAGLHVRLLAYLLLVPTFLLLRVGYYLAHPRHRTTVLSGSCPRATVLSLDWFSVGILATGLPLALQPVGTWLATNAVFVVGVFLLPRLVPATLRTPTKVGALVAGSTLFLYARFGGALATALPTPPPAAVLGPVAALHLTQATTAALLASTNGLLTGPVVVAAFAVVANRVLTRPELSDLPVIRHSLPRRDPLPVVAGSAALGTVFYLVVVAVVTGDAALWPRGSSAVVPLVVAAAAGVLAVEGYRTVRRRRRRAPGPADGVGEANAEE